MNTDNLQITVTGRHISITDAMKEYAEKKLQSIGVDFPRLLDARFILDVEKYRHQCELVVRGPNRVHLEAEAESDNMYASIDLCIDKLARQMRKVKTKTQRHRRDRKRRQPVEV